MKKILALFAAVLIILALPSCSVFDAVRTFELSDVIPAYDSGDQYHTLFVSAVEITQRASGKKLMLSGGDAESVYYNLMGVTCERSRGVKDGLSELYSIRFVMADGSAAPVLYIIDGTNFVYSGYTYSSLYGRVDIASFDLLFEK